MVVKIRFARGSVVSSRYAMLAASLLTLAAIGCAALGMWRMGSDLDWAGDFVIQTGLLSHWQVWVGMAALIQYASWKLARYARVARRVQRKHEAATGGNTQPATPV